MTLNPEQVAATEGIAHPVLVLAGPGTGKTHLMVQKYRHLVVDNGLDPNRILITTFTRKATEELEERIGKALEASGYLSKVEVQNFHAFCLNLLREHAADAGLPPDPPLLDGMALRRFFMENRDRFTWEHVPFIHWIHTPLERIQTFMGACMSAAVTPSQALDLAQAAVDRADAKALDKTRHYLDYARNYEVALNLLREKGVMTYDLMLYEAVRLLEEHPDILHKVQESYDYLLVDEVQDNNGLQARLVELIVGDRGCVTVVGDEDQGIYKFRGAQRGILERFAERFNPERVDLYRNYRSSTHIVEAAKAVIAHNTERFEDKKLEAHGDNRDHDEKVHVVGYHDEDQEAIHIAKHIHDLVQAGRRPRDIAILFRSLNHKGRLLEELEAQGIPYEITNVAQLLRLREVRDLWAWMSVVNDPYLDNPAFERVLSGHEVGLPLLTLAKVQRSYRRLLEERAREAGKDPHSVRMNLVDALQELDGPWLDDETRHRLCWARRSIEVLHDRCRGLTALDTAYELLGWLKPQKRYHPDDTRGRQVWANLGDFMQVIKDYESTFPDQKGLPGFLEHIDYLDRQGADLEEREPDATEDSVKLLTAHKAKGLQFPVVFMPGCNKDKFPLKNRGDWMAPVLRPEADTRSEHLEEERRVFYVAMTRAEQELHLSYSFQVGGSERARSQFLDELLDGANGHVEARLEDVDLEPAQTEAEAEETRHLEEVHAALRVHERMDVEQLRDRARRILEATAAAWSQEVEPSQVAAALAEYGVEVPPPAPKEEPGWEGPLRLSASALNTYAECPRKFQFGYVLRIPGKITANAVSGSNVHRALEVFHQRHKDDWRDCGDDELAAIYDEVVAKARFASPEQAEQWRERDLRILRDYLATERRHKVDPGRDGEPRHVEVRFDYEMPDLDASFFGFIDRVDEYEDGSVEIIDYKTGSRKSANEMAEKNFQIPLYVLGMEEGKGKRVRYGSLYWMKEAGDGTGTVQRMRIERKAAREDGDGKRTVLFTDDAMGEVKARIREVVEGIRGGRFQEEPEARKCGLCDYRLICPALEG